MTENIEPCELKPCPFCGEKAVDISRHKEMMLGKEKFVVEHLGIETHIISTCFSDTKEGAINRWNSAYCWRVLATQRAEYEKRIWELEKKLETFRGASTYDYNRKLLLEKRIRQLTDEIKKLKNEPEN